MRLPFFDISDRLIEEAVMVRRKKLNFTDAGFFAKKDVPACGADRFIIRWVGFYAADKNAAMAGGSSMVRRRTMAFKGRLACRRGNVHQGTMAFQ